MSETKQKSIKGIAYDVEEGKVILHKPEGDVELPLAWGQNAYSIVYSYLNKKGTAVRSTNGVHQVGNFSYTIDEKNIMTVTRKKDGSVLGTLELTEAQVKYPRTHAATFILGEVE